MVLHVGQTKSSLSVRLNYSFHFYVVSLSQVYTYLLIESKGVVTAPLRSSQVS